MTPSRWNVSSVGSIFCGLLGFEISRNSRITRTHDCAVERGASPCYCALFRTAFSFHRPNVVESCWSCPAIEVSRNVLKFSHPNRKEPHSSLLLLFDNIQLQRVSLRSVVYKSVVWLPYWCITTEAAHWSADPKTGSGEPNPWQLTVRSVIQSKSCLGRCDTNWSERHRSDRTMKPWVDKLRLRYAIHTVACANNYTRSFRFY